MKRLLSLFAFTLLLFSLAGLSYLALSGSSVAAARAGLVDATAVTTVGSPAQILMAPLAPTARNKVNVIAMPLDASEQFILAGKNFDADGLAAITGFGVTQVLTWNASSKGYRTWYPQAEEGDNFALVVGGVYRLVLNSVAGAVVSFVGDVPTIGSVTFNLVRPTATGCRLNDISVPLHRADITTADLLAGSVGNVSQVLEWNASSQSYRTWYPQAEEGDDFAVQIGYPYRLCLLTGGSSTWPPP